MEDRILIGADYETYLIGPECLAPKPVCLGATINADPEALYPDQLGLDDENCELATSGDGDLRELMESLLDSGEILVWANAPFDLAVAATDCPDLWPKIWQALEDGRISDVQVREKLLNLADTGDLKYFNPPSGNPIPIFYSLAALASKYLGVEMEGKTKSNSKGEIIEGADAWRINYNVLDGEPLEDWPEEAVEYAMLDTLYPTLIWRHQEQRAKDLAQKIGIDPLRTEAFRVAVRFGLHLFSMHGVMIDPEEHARVVGELQEALRPENLERLVAAGILTPGAPEQPYANGAKSHVEDCKTKSNCDCPVKMKAATKDKISKKTLEAYVLRLKARLGDKVTLKKTEKGNYKLDAEFFDDHYKLDPLLKEYRDRQKMQKLVTTDLPRMEWPKGSGIPARVLHASFDELKETGRTSSYASKIFPSWNGQNPHPRVRACVVPRPGFYLYSVDYSGMELGTLAQKCYDLFGFSVLKDVINKGWDAHSYLGAHLAFYLDEKFSAGVQNNIPSPTGDDLYLSFMRLKGHENPVLAKFFDHYRTFAKPTGLGYPGGLGPKTFVDYAHATYKIECSEELAKELREVWHRCFPEMKLYLDWINTNCRDPYNDGYAYCTPLGLYRSGASFCAAANGAGLQAPSAEGALLALCRISRATYDPSVGSVLYSDERGPRHRPQLFIHDEFIGEARIDVAHEVAHEVSNLMVESMRVITPDVTPRAEPVLMLRWNKKAKPVYENDRLVPWVPKEAV